MNSTSCLGDRNIEPGSPLIEFPEHTLREIDIHAAHRQAVIKTLLDRALTESRSSKPKSKRKTG